MDAPTVINRRAATPVFLQLVRKEGEERLTKADLTELRRLHTARRAIEEHIDRLRSSAERYSMPLSDMPHAPAWRDPMAEYMAKLDELQRRWVEVTAEIELRGQQMEIELQILGADEYRIMFMRYIDGYGWHKIQRRMHYSERQVFRIHAAALVKLAVNVS